MSDQSDAQKQSTSIHHAKPSDFDEIEIEPVCPIKMNMGHHGVQNSGNGFGKNAQVIAYGPTRASVLSVTEPKRRKPSLNISYSTLKDKTGFVEIMPTDTEEGFISDGTVNSAVSVDLLPSLREQGIFDGYPVRFDVEGGFAVNIRLISKVGKAAAKECMNKHKKSTRPDAQYMIEGTQFAFEGTLTTNASAMEAEVPFMEKVVNAFINNEGGHLYLGVDSDWSVKGMTANEVDLPALKQSVMEFVSDFQPFRAELADSVDYCCFAVLTKKGEIVPDRIVIRMDVRGPLEDDDGNAIGFTTGAGDRFRKNNTFITKVVM